jgi:hypothetical protein
MDAVSTKTGEKFETQTTKKEMKRKKDEKKDVKNGKNRNDDMNLLIVSLYILGFMDVNCCINTSCVIHG